MQRSGRNRLSGRLFAFIIIGGRRIRAAVGHYGRWAAGMDGASQGRRRVQMGRHNLTRRLQREAARSGFLLIILGFVFPGIIIGSHLLSIVPL